MCWRWIGNGLYLALNKDYVLDYYADLAEREVLLKVEFDTNDITTGDITDKEPELSVTKVKILEVHLIEDGEIIRKLTNKKENIMENINRGSGIYYEDKGEMITERDYHIEWSSEIVTDISEFWDNHDISNYDLNDDETYQDFCHCFSEQIERTKKQALTIDLNKENLLLSRVSLPNEIGLWDFEDCDFETTEQILSDFDIPFIEQEYEVEDDSVNFIVYSVNGELAIKTDENDTTYNLEEFKEYLIEKAEMNGQSLDLEDLKLTHELTNLHHTDILLNKLAHGKAGYVVKTMHNNEDRKAYATQVEDITHGIYRYGDFKMKEGYLVNEENHVIIVLPEKALEEQALFLQVKNEFDFTTEKINFSVKQNENDIDYLVRENNEKGQLKLNGKHYKVFEQKPSAVGDATTAILLEVNLDAEKLKDIGVKIKDVELKDNAIVATFAIQSGDKKQFRISFNQDTKDVLSKKSEVFKKLINDRYPVDKKTETLEITEQLIEVSSNYYQDNKEKIDSKAIDRKIEEQEQAIHNKERKNIKRTPKLKR